MPALSVVSYFGNIADSINYGGAGASDGFRTGSPDIYYKIVTRHLRRPKALLFLN